MSGTSEWRTPGFWNPLQFMREVSQQLVGSEAAEHMMAMSGARGMMQQLLEGFSGKFGGKRLSFGSGDTAIALTFVSLDADLDPFAASAGQVDSVSLVVRDIAWAGRTFRHGTATLRNVHVRPGARPQLVAAPIDISLWPDVSWMSRDLRSRRSYLSLVEDERGHYLLNGRSKRLTVQASLSVEVDRGALMARPTAVSAGRLRWDLPTFARRVLSRRISWDLPDGIRLHAVERTENGTRFDIRVDQWRLDWNKLMSTQPQTA
jgi:hypothetical protein